MILADVSVRRSVFAMMMTAAVIVLGAFSYKDLGLDLMPKTDVPVVNIFVNLPGASAEEIETQITKRIEEAVNTISGIDELRANSDVGRAPISINFTLERDIEAATQDVRDKVATIVAQFPRDAGGRRLDHLPRRAETRNPVAAQCRPPQRVRTLGR